MKVYLVFQCDFPTDFDGELKFASLNKHMALNKCAELGEDAHMREVELDKDIE